jgi:hypothetical protein
MSLGALHRRQRICSRQLVHTVANQYVRVSLLEPRVFLRRTHQDILWNKS